MLTHVCVGWDGHQSQKRTEAILRQIFIFIRCPYVWGKRNVTFGISESVLIIIYIMMGFKN